MEPVPVARRKISSGACRKKNEILEVAEVKADPEALVKEEVVEVLEKTKPPMKKCVTATPKGHGQAQVAKAGTSSTLLLRDKKQFFGGLDWIQGQSNKPITSTPLIVPSKLFCQRDVQTCFGFNKTENVENFDEQKHELSSICKEGVSLPRIRRSPLKPKNKIFDTLLVRYGMLEDDRKENIRTYSQIKRRVLGMKHMVFGETPKMKHGNSPKNSKKGGEIRKPKRKRQTRQKKTDQDKMSDEHLEWIEKINLEFELIMNFPLCVEYKPATD